MVKKTEANTLKLKVAEALGKDVGRALARMGPEDLERLGVAVGDVVEVVGKRTFARPMQKRDHGVFARIRFELPPANLATLRERYRLIEDLFRVQILAVDERREAIIDEQAAGENALVILQRNR